MNLKGGVSLQLKDNSEEISFLGDIIWPFILLSVLGMALVILFRMLSLRLINVLYGV